ncbi:GntR family transcriptional regulator [Phenylobacterium sp.]|jgi:DNA-binding GntR family transcriptional regulator|uniref:GntR family transcriptional regulator n=1 Tax=Phenylobacterium sp. TaxID=1871053 RepID=UPI002F40E1CD
MRNIEPLRRQNTSETVAAAVREMIVDGRLSPGERINEVRLSEALGVSRTPLREALNRLASEGALSQAPAIGYSVRPLSVAEVDQLYDIRPLLDPEALRLSGLPSPARLARLQALNRRFAAARDGETAIALDDEWHLALIEDCPNLVLVELIQGFMLRTRRYELALLRERPNLERSTQDHDRVLAALERGDLAQACAALKTNMQSGKTPILAWLSTRDETGVA